MKRKGIDILLSRHSISNDRYTYFKQGRKCSKIERERQRQR